MAGLGGPWGRINRKKSRQIEIAALMAMRRVICRLAMSDRGDDGSSKVECRLVSKLQTGGQERAGPALMQSEEQDLTEELSERSYRQRKVSRSESTRAGGQRKLSH